MNLNDPATLAFFNQAQEQLAQDGFGKRLEELNDREMALMSHPDVLALHAEQLANHQKATKVAMKGETTDKELKKLKNLGGFAEGERKDEAIKMKEKEIKEAAYVLGAHAVMKAAGYNSEEMADIAWDTAYAIAEKTAAIGKIPKATPKTDAVMNALGPIGNLFGQQRINNARSYMTGSADDVQAAIDMIGEKNYDRMAEAALEDLPAALAARRNRMLGAGALGSAGAGAAGHAYMTGDE